MMELEFKVYPNWLCWTVRKCLTINASRSDQMFFFSARVVTLQSPISGNLEGLSGPLA